MAATTFPGGLIDTDILIDQGRGLQAAAAFLTARRKVGATAISVISAMELVQGCHNARDLAAVRRVFRRLTILPTAGNTSMEALRLMDRFRLSHNLQIGDALIAATALDNDLTLYTKNIRDFQMIPGLQVVRPY